MEKEQHRPSAISDQRRTEKTPNAALSIVG
jgi:hypothetical protein